MFKFLGVEGAKVPLREGVVVHVHTNFILVINLTMNPEIIPMKLIMPSTKG